MFKIIFISLLIYYGISYLIKRFKDFGLVNSRWHFLFPDVKYSAQEFYTSLEANIKETGVPDISTSRITFSQNRFFSDKREYVRIVRVDQMFLVCAASFGKGFFISWWAGVKITLLQDIIIRLPIIGIFLARFFFSKTYFQMDTDDMFKDTIRTAVNETVEQLSTAKGVRQPTELELQPTYSKRFSI